MNNLYRSTKAMWEKDTSPEGFTWLVGNDGAGNTLAFARWSDAGECLVSITNFSPVPHENYSLPLPLAGKWIEVLNTDDLAYGGSGVMNAEINASEGGPTVLRVPPLATIWLKRL
jgi:1,4-alpha-glucan branching enzyme